MGRDNWIKLAQLSKHCRNACERPAERSLCSSTAVSVAVRMSLKRWRWVLRQLGSAVLISGDWARSDNAEWFASWKSCKRSWLLIWEWRERARFRRSIARSYAFVHDDSIEGACCSNRVDVRT